MSFETQQTHIPNISLFPSLCLFICDTLLKSPAEWCFNAKKHTCWPLVDNNMLCWVSFMSFCVYIPQWLMQFCKGESTSKCLKQQFLHQISMFIRKNGISAPKKCLNYHIEQGFKLNTTYLEVNPDFVSRFWTLNSSLLKTMGQGCQHTGRSLFQRTLGYNHNMSMGINGHITVLLCMLLTTHPHKQPASFPFHYQECSTLPQLHSLVTTQD